jgi:hypothetical protein
MINKQNLLDWVPKDTISLSIDSGEELGEWIGCAVETIKELRSAVATGKGSLQTSISLIQEAKGFEGKNGGPITDHLDAAENWIYDVMHILESAS